MQPELVGDPARLALLRRWAVLLDSAFAIPGIPIRFGLDALVGLVPGIGDLATPAFTVLLLGTGVRMRVPAVVLTRMVMNAGLDALVGLVPVPATSPTSAGRPTCATSNCSNATRCRGRRPAGATCGSSPRAWR